MALWFLVACFPPTPTLSPPVAGAQGPAPPHLDSICYWGWGTEPSPSSWGGGSPTHSGKEPARPTHPAGGGSR